MHQSSGSDLPKPRQLFVTQSRVLASRVEEHCGKLMESLSLGQKTRHELLTIAKQKTNVEDRQRTMVYNLDQDPNWKAGLPSKFSLLTDEHFPLFLTFDKVCQHNHHCYQQPLYSNPSSSANYWRMISLTPPSKQVFMMSSGRFHTSRFGDITGRIFHKT